MIRAVTLLPCVLVATLLGFESAAQDRAKSPPGSGPRLLLQVFQNSTTLTAPRDVLVTLTNLENRAYTVSRVELRLPAALEAVNEGACLRLVQGCEASAEQGAKVVIERSSQRFFNLRLPGPSGLLDSVLDRAIVTFFPGRYRILCLVEYATLDEATGGAREEVEIDLQPPLTSPLLGGVAGAFLLAIFLPLHRNWRGELGESAHPAGRAFKIGLRVFVSGTVAAVIAILLLQRMGDIQLPIAIDVKDWIGGVIVGLFSYKIGESLYGYFSGT